MNPVRERLRSVLRRADGSISAYTKIWALNVLVTAAALALLPVTEVLEGPSANLEIPSWLMVGLVVAAESSVVHFRFRRDSYTFSLSEIPLVLGLYFMEPVTFVAAHAVGNLIAFGVLRRNTPIKLVFNVAQFALQAAISILIFRSVIQLGDPLGLFGWFAVLMAAGVSLLIADFLITIAVGISGARPSRAEANDVLKFSSVAAAMNVALGLVAVTIVNAQPEAAWLAFIPIGVLFVAYRAYTAQMDERLRTAAMYEISRDLHRSPVIDASLEVVAKGTAKMFDATYASILIFPEWGGKLVYQTSVERGEIVARMHPAVFDYLADPWNGMVRSADGVVVRRPDGELLGFPGVGRVKDAMVTPIRTESRIVGIMLVGGPVSEMTAFDETDLRSFATIARQLAVSLERGRLEDSLHEVIELKEQLEESIKSKDQFIASVSHELRTPLTGIVGLAEALKSDRAMFSDEELDEFMALITEQGAELGNIIEDLLVAARADIGTLSVRPVIVDIGEQLGSILALHSAKSSGRLDVSVRGDRAEAILDPLRFRQVIRNLVTNALRYGGDHIWAEVEVRGSTVVAAIVDDGPGVPGGAEHTIFEPYGRGSNSVATPSSVGLGLAVSRQLAELMQGTLAYRRTDGLSRFELTVPLASVRLDSLHTDRD
ncbi:MAG: ATP-binding protein [Acidimicrobiia bacterium]|nr:ATP-binding protein [Acidimicrobiia bacterium]